MKSNESRSAEGTMNFNYYAARFARQTCISDIDRNLCTLYVVSKKDNFLGLGDISVQVPICGKSQRPTNNEAISHKDSEFFLQKTLKVVGTF